MRILTPKNLVFLFFLLAFSVNAQTVYYDKSNYLSALGDSPSFLETFDDNQYDLFSISPNSHTDIDTLCNTGGILAIIEESYLFTFTNPMTSFAFSIFDAGDSGVDIEIKLMTDTGQEYTVVMETGNAANCNEIFFGIIHNEMPFTMASITRFLPNGGADRVDLDNIYVTPENITKIPTLSEWGIIVLCLLFLIIGVIVVNQERYQKQSQIIPSHT